MALLDEVIRNNQENTDRIVKNAIGYLVCNNKLGLAAISTFDNTTSMSMVRLIGGMLVNLARSAVRDLDTTNDLAFLRIATRKFEYLIAPERKFTIIIAQ